MGTKPLHRAGWRLARKQHGVLTGDQLGALGFTRAAIRHRVERGRLHPLWPNTYAVGRPELSPEGTYLAAVLTCGDGAALSDLSAADLLRIVRGGTGVIEV